MESILVDKLRETNTIHNRLLARSIEKGNKYKDKSSYEYYANNKKNKRKAYNLLLKLIDEEERERLNDLDIIIESFVDSIEMESGWYFTIDYSVMCEEYYRLYENPELKTKGSCYIERTKDGYKLDKDFNETEMLFYDRYKDYLYAFNQILNEKEDLITNGLSSTDEKDQELVDGIIDYLGYKKDTKENKKSK